MVGAFNPGAIERDDGVTLLVRVAETAREQRSGCVALPRWDPLAGRAVIDWLSASEVIFDDPRVVTVRSTGLKRLTFISHLLVVRSRDGREIDQIGPTRFLPNGDTEQFGVEDPRITEFDGRFYITYVAVSRHGAATALATTSDFEAFTRLGVIFAPENKDVVLFPERIDGQCVALHRPNPAQHFTRPEMWRATSPDLIHWGGHAPLLGGEGPCEEGRIGAGAPPLRTPMGWLEIYHANGPTPDAGAGVGRYCAGAVLLDLRQPDRIVGRCPRLLVPEAPFERDGFVPNVVFPTGIVPREDTVLVYYGAADESTAVVELRLPDVLNALTQ